MHELRLRALIDADLPIFFEQQLDPVANRMAAFTAKDPTDREAFAGHWARIREDSAVTHRTILLDERVIGYVAGFERMGEPEVTYWIDREYWGKGIATAALGRFLKELATRPLYARVAADNAASVRVLEKCGFTITGRDRYFANARGQEIEELILTLPAHESPR